MKKDCSRGWKSLSLQKEEKRTLLKKKKERTNERQRNWLFQNRNKLPFSHSKKLWRRAGELTLLSKFKKLHETSMGKKAVRPAGGKQSSDNSRKRGGLAHFSENQTNSFV